MRYSITSRFYGTLLGATIAEKITNPSKANEAIAKILIPGAQSLVELGRFERQSWLEKLLILELTPLQAVVATLPLALFYHDNKINLRSNLLSVASIWQHEPVIQESILAIGYAIAQALTEKLYPIKLIPQILSFIEPSTELNDALQQVQTLLEQKAGIEKTIIVKGSSVTTSVALAFYYFLSTVEDINLSVKRSRQSPFVSREIVGALSGAYNSAANIPSSWQVADSPTCPKAEMLQLSEDLVAVWSGVYDSNQLISTAVAAPRVIRSR
jgi:hypothetical protein